MGAKKYKSGETVEVRISNYNLDMKSQAEIQKMLEDGGIFPHDGLPVSSSFDSDTNTVVYRQVKA